MYCTPHGQMVEVSARSESLGERNAKAQGTRARAVHAPLEVEVDDVPMVERGEHVGLVAEAVLLLVGEATRLDKIPCCTQHNTR